MLKRIAVIGLMLTSFSSWGCYYNFSSVEWNCKFIFGPDIQLVVFNHEEGVPVIGCKNANYDPEVNWPGINYSAIESHKVCPSGVTSPSKDSAIPSNISPHYSVCEQGSIINVDSQSVLEKVRITGLPFSIVYSGDNVPGRKTWREATVPLTQGDSQESPVMLSKKITVEIAGKVNTSSLLTSNSSAIFQWDGLGSDGNYVTSSQTADVVVHAQYDGVASPPASLIKVLRDQVPHQWFHYEDSMMVSEPIISEALVFTPPLDVMTMHNSRFSGWDFEIHHHYDSESSTLHRGDGGHIKVSAITRPNGEKWVVSEDRSETYVFDSANKHIITKHGLTGSIIYTFQYDLSRLIGITDAFGNQTTLQYNGGTLSSITSPFGHVTQIESDANGKILSITNPENEKFEMTYQSDGLLLTFRKPSGTITTMTYDGSGRLLSDVSSSGSEVLLSKSTGILTKTSAMGISEIYEIIQTSQNSYKRKKSFAGREEVYTESIDLKNNSLTSNYGVAYNQTFQNDSRFNSTVRYPASTSITEGIWTRVENYAEAFTLSDPTDPFSLSSWSSTSSINGKNIVEAYNPSTGTTVLTTPENRTLTTILDQYGRTTSIQVGSYTPVNLSYETRGRIQSISQGVNRVTQFSYDSLTGFLESITNSLGQVQSFDYDGAGRLIAQTLPDSRVIRFSYDVNGNLASVEPPGKPTHNLSYNGNDQLSEFTPPLVLNSTSTSTFFTYNNDRQVTEIQKPNGEDAQFLYDNSTGLLSSLVLPSGMRTFLYNKGFIEQSNSEDQFTLLQFRSGTLLTTEHQYGGVLNQVIDYSYNNDFLITDESLAGTSVGYTYDNDGLLLSRGNLIFNRASVTGEIISSTLGNITQNFSYSSTFGELSSLGAVYNSGNVYQESYTRDHLGRIITKTETYGSGTSDLYEYGFDPVGRLIQVKLNGVIRSDYSYDSNSNRYSQTVNGVTLSATYDPSGFNIGNVHTCAITPEGVKCWGYGQAGYLGYGNTINIGDNETLDSVGYVDIGGTAEYLGLGDAHTCALLTGGGVRCWGGNAYGQLGLGHLNTIGDNEVPSSQPLVDIGGSAKKLASGALHTCVLKTDNTVTCWGLGSFGRLGYGNTNTIGDNELPSVAGNVATGVSSEITQIVAGTNHTCILTANGNVKCWGRNAYFQLGQGAMAYPIGDDETPDTVGFINFGEPVMQIAAGGDHTCALLQSKKLKCWGRNDSGQLGLGNTTILTTALVNHPYVDVGSDVKYVQAGKTTTCVITINDQAKCWGANNYGQLGLGHTNTIGDNEHPSSIPAIDLGGVVVAIDSSGNHTCATMSTGGMYCWGAATYGVLGYGNGDTLGDDELAGTSGEISFINHGSIFYDEQDRLIRFGSKTFTYNDNGELLSYYDSSDSSTRSFTYDFFGNLKQAVLPTKTINYKVDALNRRVAKYEGENLVEFYVWNYNNQLIGVVDNLGALTRYVYGSKQHAPDYMIRNDVKYQIVSNHLGSPVVAVNSSSGVVAQEIKYDEWGNILSDSNPGFMPFGYAGCLYDNDTKLCRFGARDYDSSIGRWLSKDPILFAGGDTNLYGYVMQDPINWIDPSGLKINDKDGLVALLMSSPIANNPEMMKVLNFLQQSSTTIEVSDALIMQRKVYGETRSYGDNFISVHVDVNKHRSQEGLWNTIMHELLHAYNKLNKNGAYDESTVRQRSKNIIGSDCF